MKAPVVLITGALTGIGRATALAFAHEGARLVVSGRRDEAGQALGHRHARSPSSSARRGGAASFAAPLK
jgi:NAD(P)-dependent dehydrogenase (short-subunit alcohol dehydrogenase family)